MRKSPTFSLYFAGTCQCIIDSGIINQHQRMTISRPITMDLESVKKFLENNNEDREESTVRSMPRGFIESTVMQGVKIDRIERGRVICSFTVPDRLVSDEDSLHGGALATMLDLVAPFAVLTLCSSPVTGSVLDINISYLNRAYLGEEIEIESRALQVGDTFASVSADFRSKKSGKVIAQGRHTSYLVVRSKI